MRKLLALFALASATIGSMAQVDNTFQFTDKNGSAVENGATITITDVTIDEDFGDLFLNSGLSVKNISDAAADVRVVYDITTMDSGSLQVCFPVTCNVQTKTGVFETATGTKEAGDETSLQSEWFPEVENYGRCTVIYRLELMQRTGEFPFYKYEKAADGPSVTVNYIYADPAGIKDIVSNLPPDAPTYNLSGRRATTSGVRIVKLQDGRAVKYMK